MRFVSVALLGPMLLVTSLGADPGPPTDEQVAAAVAHAVATLLANQERYEPDPPVGGLPEEVLPEWQEKERVRLAGLRKSAAEQGGEEWPYEGVYRVRPDGRIPPGYRVGGTAIVCEAILEASVGAPSELREARRAAVERGIRFMLRMLADDPEMQPRKQTNYDVRGWGQAYALKFFLRALETDLVSAAPLRAGMREAIPHLIACLEEGQVPGGGWNYAGRGVSPFMTGSTLLALFEAKRQGFRIPEELVEGALDALEGGRGESMAYAYSGRLRDPAEPMEGSSARSAIAELCLYKAGRSDLASLRKAVDGFFEERNWEQLLVRKSRQGTHVPPYGVAPYYFFFGHTYAALAVEALPEEERSRYRERMRELLWRTIEGEGRWNDRIFPRTESYSTAMAILALVADRLPAVPSWGAPPEDAKERAPGKGVDL